MAHETEAMGEREEINELTRRLAHALDVAEAAPSGDTSALLRAETGMHQRLVPTTSNRALGPPAAYSVTRTRYAYLSGFAGRGTAAGRQSQAPEHTIAPVSMPGEQLARYLRM